MSGKELKEYAQTLGITASNRTNRQLVEALGRKTGQRSPRADTLGAISHHRDALAKLGVDPVDVLRRLDGKDVGEGDRVSWQWAGGRGAGEVRQVYTKPVSRNPKGASVKRNGSPENPALVITPDNGGTTVVKLASEVRLLPRTDARKCSPPWRGTLGSCTRGAEAGSKRSIANIARGGKMTPERKARQERIKALKSKGGSVSLKDLDKSDKMLENSARKLGIELPKFKPGNLSDVTIESVGGKATKANKAFDKTAKNARNLKDVPESETTATAKLSAALKSGMKATNSALNKAKRSVYETKTPKELKSLAKAAGIKGYPKMKKKQVIDALVESGAKLPRPKQTMEEELRTVANARSAVNQARLVGRAKTQINDLTELGRRARREPESRRMRKLAQNAIRKFNRRADAMGWSDAVRMDAIALLLEVLN